MTLLRRTVSRLLTTLSALFGVAQLRRNDKPVVVQPVAICYTRLDGIPLGRYWRPLFAWFGDLDLVPHLWQMVCLGETEVVVTFFPPVDTEKLVLIAAPSSIPDLFADFSRLLNVGPRSQAAMAGRVERLSGRPLKEFQGGRQLARMPVPTLVIHAPDDKEVSARHADLYAGAGDHVRLHWANGLGHRRILADPGVVERVVAFVAERARPELVH